MKGRYQLRHDSYGFGLRFTRLDLAVRELGHAAGGGWFIFDRLEKKPVGGAK